MITFLLISVYQHNKDCHLQAACITFDTKLGKLLHFVCKNYMREDKGDLVIIGNCSFFQLSRIFSLALLFCFVLIIVYYQFNIFSGVRTCVLGVQVKLCPCR